MFKAIIKFLQEARTELIKVTWPTRSAAVNLTLAVILVSAVITAYTGGVDYLLTQGVKWLTVASQSQNSSNGNNIDLSDVQGSPINIEDLVEVTPEE